MLRVIAGLLATSQGEVRLGEQVWDDPSSGRFVAPNKRSVGLVF